MTKKLNVQAFSSKGRRIIATVLQYARSPKYSFSLLPEDADTSDPESQLHLSIVDANDPVMMAQWEAACKVNPDLKAIYLVTAEGQTNQQKNTLMGSQLVSHLVPMLEKAADAMPAPKPLAPRLVPAPIAPKVVQLVAKPVAEKLRALVVDDSPTVRVQMANILERIGMRCDLASSGPEALARLTGQSYQIIFVDVVMPGMDGYKLTREIKQDRAHKSTPVIILTSKSSPFDRARGALAGCDTYLTKPVELKRLYDSTARCLSKSMAVADLSGMIVDPTAVAPAAQPVRAAQPPQGPHTQSVRAYPRTS